MAESTFAYFSAAWLLSAPIVGYVVALHRHMRRISAKAIQERVARVRLAKHKARGPGTSLGGGRLHPWTGGLKARL